MDENHLIPAYDALGQWLQVGDVILYAVTQSSHITLNVGVIEAITGVLNGRDGTEPQLAIRRRRVDARFPAGEKISRTTLVAVDRVVKLHPTQYNGAVEALLAAA